MDLRGKDPINTYQYLLNTEGARLYNGTGSLLDGISINHVSSSFISSSFITASGIQSLNVESRTITASVSMTGSLKGSLVGTSSWASNSVTASFLGNNPYASIFSHNTNHTMTIANSNVYYAIGGNTASYLSGFTFSNQGLTASFAGTYAITWDLALDAATNNQEIEATIFVNRTSSWYSGSSQHTQVVTSGKPVSMGGNGIIRISANDAVGLCLLNATSTNNIIINHCNLTITRIDN